MSKSRKKEVRIPEKTIVETELKRIRFKSRYFKILRSTLYALVVTAAVSVLVATLFLPVLQIYGNSMSPTLSEGEIVVSIKKQQYDQGDVVALYYSNRVLVKRVIATSGDIVELDDKGNFIINGVTLNEPYLEEKYYGESTDLEFPYVVPAGTYFVVGDKRKTSIDSRNSQVGCIVQDEMVGEILLTIWPLNKFGGIN